YMDDLHIGGATERELMENLMIVLDRLHKFNLKIQLSKTKFFVCEVKVLGVIYSSTGKKVDPEKVKAIQEFPAIDTLKKTQCFLGMLAFLGSFIPHFSTTCSPIYALLKNQKEKKFTLTVEAMQAFEAIKKYISKTTMLYHPNFEKPFYLSTDASNLAAGAFLYQVEGYEKSEKGKKKMLQDLGFEIKGGGGEPFILPGVSPGKNTPVVTEFAGDTDKIKQHDR
ncbi:MAG: RNase H-like domain-containing protein, partial [bacterium]